MDKIGKKASKENLKVVKEALKAKSKEQRKKPKEEIKSMVFSPKTRLEPRLNVSSSEENKKKKETVIDIEKDRRLVVSLNANEIDKLLKYDPEQYSPSTSRDSNGIKKDLRSILKKRSAAKVLLDNIEDEFGDEEDFLNFVKKTNHHVARTKYWTDKEMKDLAYALQLHGFSDMKKIANEVKTKTENDIAHYLTLRIRERRREKTLNYEPERNRGRPQNCWTTVSHENLETWPTIRKWKRLAYEQMLLYTRTKDYSKPVISAMCNKFSEEEPEPEDPQVINVKLIYKYIADCMAGTIPLQLPPKESALVLDMLREVRMMPIAYDFEEEREFLKDYKKATTFKPMQVKDEFKKKLKIDMEHEDPTAIAVPEEVFLELSRHKRLLQSFNPLVTPVWMLQKEQEHLKNYFEESNVYID